MPVPTVTISEDNPAVLMDRVRATSGSYITQASLTSVKYRVFDTADGTEVGAEGTLTTADVVFDALQTGDARWDEAGGDATGYNFLAAIPGSRFPDSGKVYQVEVTFDPVTGETFRHRWHVATETVYSS